MRKVTVLTWQIFTNLTRVLIIIEFIKQVEDNRFNARPVEYFSLFRKEFDKFSNMVNKY